MREALSVQLHSQDLIRNRNQILDDWLQNPTENILFHLPRRIGSTTLMEQAVQSHPGFFLEHIGEGLEQIVCERNRKCFCMGTTSRRSMLSFVGYRCLRATN